MDAVARQIAHPPGSVISAEAGERECAIRQHVLALLHLATGGEPGQGPRAAAEVLARDERLLSVFFGNIDLLYDHGWSGADSVSLAVVGAVEIGVGGAGE